MKIRITALAAMAAVILSGTASALTITNNDKQDYKLTVTIGETTKNVTIKPEETIKDICSAACSIRLNGDEENEYDLEVGEIVSIEENSIVFYDTQQEDTSTNNQQSQK